MYPTLEKNEVEMGVGEWKFKFQGQLIFKKKKALLRCFFISTFKRSGPFLITRKEPFVSIILII